MRFLLLVLLVSSTVSANKCSPKKSNPKNEQCAKDLMKDGIGSLPTDLQSQLMEPLVSSLAKKLTKDIMDDMNGCEEPKKPKNQCQGTSDFDNFAKPSSEQGKKMFESAAKGIDKNANELVKDVEGKIGDIGKKLGNQVMEKFKNLLGDTHGLLPNGSIPDVTDALAKAIPNANVPKSLGDIENSLNDALGGLKKKMEGAINGTLGDGAKKHLDDLKKKVTDMPEAGLEYLNKQLKDKAGDLVGDTLGPLEGEMKGVVDGFIGGLGPEGLNLTNPNVTALVPKIEWLKKKLGDVADQYGVQFGIGATAVTGGVFASFLADVPDEVKEKEIITLHDVVFLGELLLRALDQTNDNSTTSPDLEASTQKSNTLESFDGSGERSGELVEGSGEAVEGSGEQTEKLRAIMEQLEVWREGSGEDLKGSGEESERRKEIMEITKKINEAAMEMLGVQDGDVYTTVPPPPMEKFEAIE